MMSDRAYSPTSLGFHITQQPQSQVDIVDCAVVEDASILGCITNEEAGRVEQVGSLGTHEKRLADFAFVDLELGGAIGRVETTGVACHYFEVRILFCEGADGAGLKKLLISSGTPETLAVIREKNTPLASLGRQASRKAREDPS